MFLSPRVPADGDDRRMLDEDQDAGVSGIGEDLGVDLHLLVPRGAIAKRAEIEDLED